MKVLFCFPEGKTKALTMSYDDGSVADKRLIATFNQYGIKGTFNLNYGLMQNAFSDKVQKSEVAEVYKGHEVATHAATHAVLNRCPLPYVAEEILEDRKGLESLVGYVVRGHAFPYGSYSKEIEELLKKLGIAYARVVSDQPSFGLPDNPMKWKPTCHHNDLKLMEYAENFVNFNKWAYLNLMHVWGHSSEFNLHNNWHIIEKFCEFVGGRSDIWYATNIEIIDYLNAVKKLQYNTACSFVYNPNAISVWLRVGDGVILEAKGGCYTEFCNL